MKRKYSFLYMCIVYRNIAIWYYQNWFKQMIYNSSRIWEENDTDQFELFSILL